MNCLWSYHRTLPSIKFRLIATSGCSNHSVAVCEQGNTWTWGRNDAGQLGLGHAKSVQGQDARQKPYRCRCWAGA
eukprot:scaffold1718_cov363-Prasinococcus_capsulatus_cf.AAC.6